MDSDSSDGRGSRRLFGRDDELALMRAFVAHTCARGGALVVSGEGGIGRTALLDAAAAYGRAAGVRVLRAVGAESETSVNFAGLHQVLLPLFDQLSALDASWAGALGVALGMRTGPRPDPLTVSNAVLGLLIGARADRRLLVMVNDLSRLDQASAEVLGMVVRRLPGSGVGFLGSTRTGKESYFDSAGLPSCKLGPLDDAAAAAAIDDRFPSIAPAVRQRVLSEARGNPLALRELPAALSRVQLEGNAPLPELLPLSRRIRSVFETQLRELPEPTRHLLLLAALEEASSLKALQAAPTSDVLKDLAPAERALLINIAGGAGRLEFRHPLTRAAVLELSTSDQRRNAHASLAGRLVDQPERQAWHLAHAIVGPDEKVAALLERVADRIRRRGDAVGALTALLRAAELSPLDVDRSRRLATAAYMGASGTGDLRRVPQLLADARRADGTRGDSLVAVSAAAHHVLLSGEGDIDTVHRMLINAINKQSDPLDITDDATIVWLGTLSWLCYFGGRADLWGSFHRALDRISPEGAGTLELSEGTLSDPARTALPVLRQLDLAIAAMDAETDPAEVARITVASVFVDRLAACRSRLRRLCRAEPGQRAVTQSVIALYLLGLDSFMTGDWNEVPRLADEHSRLCQQHNYRLMECGGIYLRAMLAAARGDNAATVRLTDQMIRWATPRGSLLYLRFAAQARTLARLGAGDFEDAYRHATEVSPAGELASHVPQALWMIMDLVEAAVRTGRHPEAEAHIAAARSANVTAISPRYAFLVEAATAMTASDETAFGIFEKALAIADVECWPFELARVQLIYGERLRRVKATTQARSQLNAALETFQRLGACPWITRTELELRATGITVENSLDTRAELLTPQQREIVQLAAGGLTNKQIAERLFLSTRTVSSHLYRAFPKLGVPSRAALRDALRAPGW